MNKKKAIKVIGASAIAATAFVATAPTGADAASVSQVKELVQKAKDAGTVLKWAISMEGSADGSTRPWDEYNGAKVARDQAVAAINTLPAAQKAGYLADIEQNVNLHINRAMAYIDAITAGEKINVKKAALAAQIEKNVIDDSTEAAYHALSTEIRKQAILLDRVYGQSTRDAIRAEYKQSAETVRDSVQNEVTVKMELDLAEKAIAAGDSEAAEKHLTEAANYLKDAKNAEMKAALTNSVDELKAELKIEVKSLTAVNAKTLEVKFNKAVDFTAEDFAVSKGTVKSNVANVTLSEDKTSAQIELTSKLTKGDYTVSVKNDKEALTATVSVADEKVAGVEVLSGVAPLADDKTTATVGFQITNQYGEDVTKLNASSVTVTVSGAATGGALNPDGTLTLTGVDASAVKEGDKVTITLVHGATATTSTKTVSLSASSISSEATVGALYNKDGKTLSQDTDLAADKFYLPITVKDQYGKEITSATRANSELIITNTNPAAVTFADNNEIKEVVIDGKDVLALEVSDVNLAGTTTVLAIAKANGQSTQATVSVNEGVKVASATLSAPTELVTANKDTFFPLTVVDSAGNEVTTEKALDAINDDLTVTGGSIVEVDGKGLFVKVAAGNVTANSPVTVVVNTSLGKVSTQTVVAKAEAVATVITGLSKDVDSAIRTNGTLTIANTDLVVEDQYGQVITDEDVLAALNFEVTAPDAETFVVAPVGGLHTSYTVKPEEEAEKSSEKLTFKLLNAEDAAIEASAFTKAFSIVKDSDFASYKVEDIKPIYVTETLEEGVYEIAAGYNQDTVVKATSKSGNVVTLTEGTDYSVTGKDASKVKFASGSDTATQTITITINATGEQLTKEITYSKAAAKPAKVELAADGTTAAAEKYDLVTKENVATKVNADKLEELLDVIVTDQYGVKELADDVDANETGIDTITFTKVSGNVTFTANGTKGATVATADQGAVVNATINVGGQKATVQLTFTGAVTTP